MQEVVCQLQPTPKEKKNIKSDISCIPGAFSDKVIPNIDLIDVKNTFLDDRDIPMITIKVNVNTNT